MLYTFLICLFTCFLLFLSHLLIALLLAIPTYYSLLPSSFIYIASFIFSLLCILLIGYFFGKKQKKRVLIYAIALSILFLIPSIYSIISTKTNYVSLIYSIIKCCAFCIIAKVGASIK